MFAVLLLGLNFFCLDFRRESFVGRGLPALPFWPLKQTGDHSKRDSAALPGLGKMTDAATF